MQMLRRKELADLAEKKKEADAIRQRIDVKRQM